MGVWGSEALVDGERLREVLLGLAVVMAEVAPAVSFQGPGFLEGGGQVPGDAESSGVVIARLRGVADPGVQLAEAVQDLGLAWPPAAAGVDGEGFAVAGGGGFVVAGELLQEAEVVACPGEAVYMAEVAELLEGLPEACRRGWVVAGQTLQDAEFVDDERLPVPVLALAGEFEGLALVQLGLCVVAC